MPRAPPARSPRACGAPPFHLAHGDADDAVPLAQSEALAAALRRAAWTSSWSSSRGAGHFWRDAAPDRVCAAVRPRDRLRPPRHRLSPAAVPNGGRSSRLAGSRHPSHGVSAKSPAVEHAGFAASAVPSARPS